jgi:glycosyltransferase involved in cell wall biosynthesis
LRGGIPNRDLDALHAYWQVIPSVRGALFEDLRPGYSQLRIAKTEIKPTIFGHPEFTAFNAKATELFAKWRKDSKPHLTGLDKDGLPKALIEALSSGRPIVTTDVPGCREVCNDGTNGLLVPARDVTALSSAIEKLVLNPELRQAMGRAGRLRSETEFSNEIVCSQTLDLYRKLMSQ